MIKTITSEEVLKKHRGPITSVVLVPTINAIISSGYDGAVGCFNLSSKEFSLLGYHDHLVNRVVSNKDGTLIASASSDYSIKIWDVFAKKCIYTLKGHIDDVEDFTFLDNFMGVSTSRDKQIIFWDLESGTISKKIYGHEKDVLSVDYYDEKIYTTGDDKTLRVWDIHTGELLYMWGPFDVETDTCAVDIHHNRVVLGCDDGIIRIFSLSSGKPLKEIKAHLSGIKKVSVSINGDILSAAYDQRLLIWDAKDYSLKLELENINTKWERSLTWSPSGEQIIAGTFDGTVCIWEAETGKMEDEIGKENNDGNACFNDISVFERNFAVVSDDGYIRTGCIDENIFIDKIEPSSGRYLMNAVHFHKDKIYAGAHNQKLHTFLLKKPCSNGCQNPDCTIIKKETLIGEGPINTIKASQFETVSVFIGCYSGAIVKTDETGNKKNKFVLHDGAVKAISLHPHEPFGISCSAGGELISWDYSGNKYISYAGHNAIINDIDFDPTGEMIASVSRDFSLKIFQFRTGELLHTIELGAKSLKSVLFLDQNTVIVGDYWGNIIKVNIAKKTASTQKIATNGISSLARTENDIFAASYDGSVYQLDRENLHVLKKRTAMIQRGI
ncbi:WD40 repeat domain-containing protein [Bacillus chungangensis]|uniref:WD40 repeat protein n=1 Tax=Bacillus chungangensis TaxID=587633 RepID=A0ABT9WW07_9BACI|nr:WD40 repeat domain-containing protein [Bacillus chungangensis]MDQ0177486.1 WD40 repeat protein [Bacillus chungangensis]